MDTPSFPEVLGKMLESWQNTVHTAFPGTVRAFSASTFCADVEPGVEMAGERLPILPAIPVVWPLAYRALEVGETVLVICCEAELSAWRQRGTAGPPADEGRHSLTGAVVIAGLRTTQNVPSYTAGTVLPGDPICLSGYDAAQQTVRATAWAAGVDDFLAKLALWLAWATAGIQTIYPLTPPTLLSDLVTAIAAYRTGLSSTYLSDKVKIP